MASVQTLGPICTLVTAGSVAVQLSTIGVRVTAFLLQNQGSVTVYLGDLNNTASSAAVQIAAGASFNPDKHQSPRSDLQVYGLDNYYVSTRSTTTAICALLYHEILNR